MQARPGGQSHHRFLEQELLIRAGSLHFVLRDGSSPAFFPLRVGGSEGVYKTGQEKLPQYSEGTAWTFATFPRVKEGLKIEPPLEEY